MSTFLTQCYQELDRSSSSWRLRAFLKTEKRSLIFLSHAQENSKQAAETQSNKSKLLVVFLLSVGSVRVISTLLSQQINRPSSGPHQNSAGIRACIRPNVPIWFSLIHCCSARGSLPFQRHDQRREVRASAGTPPIVPFNAAPRREEKSLKPGDNYPVTGGLCPAFTLATPRMRVPVRGVSLLAVATVSRLL